MLRLVKIVNYKKPYKSKVDGKEHPSTQLYLVVPKATANGEIKDKYVAIRPKFDSSAKKDLYELESVAEIVTIKDEPTPSK